MISARSMSDLNDIYAQGETLVGVHMTHTLLLGPVEGARVESVGVLTGCGRLCAELRDVIEFVRRRKGCLDVELPEAKSDGSSIAGVMNRIYE